MAMWAWSCVDRQGVGVQRPRVLDRLLWPVGRLPRALRDVDGGQLAISRGSFTVGSLGERWMCGIRSRGSLQDPLDGLCWSQSNSP